MTYVMKQSIQIIRYRKSELPRKKECYDKFNNVSLSQLNKVISRHSSCTKNKKKYIKKKNKNTNLRRLQIPSLCSDDFVAIAT